MGRIAPFTALLILTGCAFSPRGFDRGALTRAARVEQQEVTDAEIARVLALRPQLTFPFRLAVWFRPPRTERWARPRFEWRDADREVVLAALRPFLADGIVSEIAAITDTTILGDDLRAARLAAARHGADVVLVVTGASDVDRYNNLSALLYATLVGLWIAPGSHADGMFLASGSLWDVRNEFLYATVEAEGTFGRTRPALLLEDGEVVARAKRAALAALAEELGRRVRNLREAPPAPAGAHDPTDGRRSGEPADPLALRRRGESARTRPSRSLPRREVNRRAGCAREWSATRPRPGACGSQPLSTIADDRIAGEFTA